MIYKELEEFKNSHQGEDIYVIASGPSVDYIDTSFFSNKITIGVNQMYKFFQPTYLVRKEGYGIHETIGKNPTVPHFITKGRSGKKNNLNLDYVKGNLNKSEGIVILFDHDDNTHQMPNALPENGLVVSYSTITTAIHLAAYMGAKTILLVGHDCGSLDDKMNCENYHTQQSLAVVWKNPDQYLQWVSRNIESQTIKLKGLLKEKYGCNIYSINPFINFNLEGHVYKKV